MAHKLFTNPPIRLYGIALALAGIALAGGILVGMAMRGGNQSPVSPTVKVSQSYGQGVVSDVTEQEQKQEGREDLERIYTDDFCTFVYDPNEMSVSDLSDSSVEGSYLSLEPLGGIPSGSISHLELFGGEKLTIPKDYTEESWKEYAKDLAASYYGDTGNLNMSVPEVSFNTANGVSMRAKVCVAASADIPAMTAHICAVNGENKSLVMVATTYENDPVDIKPYLDVMEVASAK